MGPQTDIETYISDSLLRAQFAAVFVPTRRSVVVFGGSRYFTGEYFHDLLELRMPSSTSQGQRTSVLGDGQSTPCPTLPLGEFQDEDALPRQFRRDVRSRLTQGVLGRFRGMLRDRVINREEFDEIIESF